MGDLPPEPSEPTSRTTYRQFRTGDRFLLPWDPDHLLRQQIEAGHAISAREATWLLAELDRLHDLEAALLDSDRTATRLAAAMDTARAANPRGADAP